MWAFSGKKGAITFVEVINEQGNMVEKFCKEEVEQACMQENEQHFHQANDTPFMRSPLVKSFGYLGIGIDAKAVLHGTYQPPSGTDPYAVMLLKQLQIPNWLCSSPSVPAHITTEEFIQGWRKAKEWTSTGSPLLHFDHFKAGIQDPVIAEFEATMAHIPYASGYSPN